MGEFEQVTRQFLGVEGENQTWKVEHQTVLQSRKDLQEGGTQGIIWQKIFYVVAVRRCRFFSRCLLYVVGGC